MVVQLFMSHTKLDKAFCDKFDVAAARVGVRVFRSEFETIKPPAWKTIKKQMELSSAMFLLVGKKLVEAQAASNRSVKARDAWKHTKNWIAYEVGLACQRGIDVWVICDDVDINFPVPYLNNYALNLESIEEDGSIDKIGLIRWILEEYSKGKSFPFGIGGRGDTCVYEDCLAQYNLHSQVEKNGEVVCPTCLRTNVYPEGWLLDEE